MTEQLTVAPMSERLRIWEDGRVNISNLEPEELTTSEIPNEFLRSIWVEFTSKAGKKYHATHIRGSLQNESWINFTSRDKNEADFDYVYHLVVQESSGEPIGSILDRGRDFCKAIDLPRTLTPQQVVIFLGRYGTHFDDVKISEAFYHNVPSDIRAKLASL